ncbi:extensin-like [Cynara cardunculus var. scolymus]|uniref:Uncharacterized protein n=1 Tax=Cynara cardunculus var. scolymus TaxID=59895 RepID=A0A118JX99_CYNCS|nr:extensin-like [Cynara cardunculus var. scolymus]KVH95951.1 hypothetical protein Ccrd_001957 [Cynara cardunculus var. scolymus]
MCYIGKATKIFIFIVAAIVVTGLVVGFGLFGRNIHPKSHKCTGEYCSLPDYSPPPPLQFPFPSVTVPNASNPSDPTFNSDAPPPPPSASPTDPSSSPPLPPPLPVSIVTPPAVATTDPPLAFSPPSPVPSPGPITSS